VDPRAGLDAVVIKVYRGLLNLLCFLSDLTFLRVLHETLVDVVTALLS